MSVPVSPSTDASATATLMNPLPENPPSQDSSPQPTDASATANLMNPLPENPPSQDSSPQPTDASTTATLMKTLPENSLHQGPPPTPTVAPSITDTAPDDIPDQQSNDNVTQLQPQPQPQAAAPSNSTASTSTNPSNMQSVQSETRVSETQLLDENPPQESQESPEKDPESQKPVPVKLNQRKKGLDKGGYCNITTFSIMIIGAILLAVSQNDSAFNNVATIIFRLGLFGFAGGITNSVAIHMIFEEIPYVYGSGIIPKNFIQIRRTVKNTIMKTFFDQDYLERYITEKADSLVEYVANQSNGADSPLNQMLTKMIASPTFDQMIDKRLAEMTMTPIGMMLVAFGQSPALLKPVVKQFISNSALDIGPMVTKHVHVKEILNPERLKLIRGQLDTLMSTKLEELTPEMVKRLIEEVIRDHLGWLVLWGALISGILGVITAIITISLGVCI